MKAKVIVKSILFCLFVAGTVLGQGVEEETGFKYVKGNYLFDSGRFDEAIQIYNDIIKGAPDFEDVLIYRARAKYALGAYKGAKKDGLEFIRLNGLNEAVCLIMGQAELGLGNPLIAISYLDYSLMMNRMNADALLFRGDAYFELEDDVAACTDWHKAKRLGSDRASQKTRTYCSRVAIPIDDEPVSASDKEVVVDNGDDHLDDGEILSTGGRKENTEGEEEVLSGDEVLSTDDLENEGSSDDEVIEGTADNSEDDYIYDSSNDDLEADLDEEFPDDPPIFDEPLDIVVEYIEIDEDLDIKLYDGIGSREVRVIPDILILSDKAGQVVVNICVDQSGNVSSAALNRKLSTVGSAGLISLALRKSREFKFERSRNREQCGKVAFIIK